MQLRFTKGIRFFIFFSVESTGPTPLPFLIHQQIPEEMSQGFPYILTEERNSLKIPSITQTKSLLSLFVLYLLLSVSVSYSPSFSLNFCLYIFLSVSISCSPTPRSLILSAFLFYILQYAVTERICKSCQKSLFARISYIHSFIIQHSSIFLFPL